LNVAGRHLHSGDRKGNVSMPEHQQLLVADEVRDILSDPYDVWQGNER